MHYYEPLACAVRPACGVVVLGEKARIRHIFMTPKQIREERLRKYRVGFMGMQPPRRFDRND